MHFLKKTVSAGMLLSLLACATTKAPSPPKPNSAVLAARRTPDLSLPVQNPEEGLKRAIAAYKAGDSEAALRTARLVAERFPDTEWYPRALYLTEQVLIQMDRPAEADAAMLRVVAEYPEMGDYAVFILADYHFSKSRFTEAAALFGQVAVRYPVSSLAIRARVRQGQALLESSAPAQAADVLDAVFREFPRSDSAPDAGLSLGQVLLADTRVNDAVRMYRDLWVRFPGTPADQEAGRMLAWLSASGIDVPDATGDEWYERGRNLFRLAQYDKAAEAFTKLLEQDPRSPHRAEALLRTGISQFSCGKRSDAVVALEKMLKEYPRDEHVPEALYWAGKSYGKLGEREKAVASFQKIVDSHADSEWADDALFLTGNIYRDANDMKKALRYYNRLVAEYPDSRYADSAVWWNAWSYYRAGEYGKADRTLQELISRYPRSFLVHQAHYWRGRIAEKRGDTEKSAEQYAMVVKRGTYTYYGYRAAERLAGGSFAGGDALNASLELPAGCEEGNCPEEPLASAEPEDAPPLWTDEVRRVLSADPSYRKSLELMQLDMKKEAAAELGYMQNRMLRRPGAVIGVSKAFFELGDYHRSLMLVLRNYDHYLDMETPRTSPDLWMLAYPQGYWDSILAYSRKYGQDPYFIAAIIREESQFREEALSPAGARGVMQVMPETGKWIARAIRLPGFDASKLFESDTAINIGTWYIGYLMKRFRGDPLYVAAAYNAGPEAVTAWTGKGGIAGERDEFVEAIPFSETRSYVKKVLRNYAEYKRIYTKTTQVSAKTQTVGKDTGAVAASGGFIGIPSDRPGGGAL
jgi:soluble lytic murein transglycosylase